MNDVTQILSRIESGDPTAAEQLLPRDKSLEDSDDLPEPDVLAQEIADDLQTALEQFTAIAVGLRQ
jgi:hypothetical protein